MNKREIKKTIRAKEAEMDRLRAVSDNSGSISEVREIGETLKKLRDEINELEDELAKIEDAEEEEAKRSAGSLHDFLQKQSEEARASLAGGSKVLFSNGVKDSNSIYLRSDESMTSRLRKADQKQLDFGKFVRGAVTGLWEDAAEERAAMTTDAMGVVIPQYCAAKIVDAARNVSLFAAAGVPIVPMESNNLTIARVKADPAFGFKAEGAEQAEANSFELEPVELKAKTAYGYAYVSLEAIHSAKNLNQILVQAFSQAMADSIDKGMLYGDDNAPAGILNAEGVNEVTATNSGYTDYVKAIGMVRRANGTPSVLGINADTEEQLSLLADQLGQPLKAPAAVEALEKVVSNQLNADSAAGSDALVFDPNAMVIGVQNHITVRIFRDSDFCIKNGLVGFQLYSMLDCAAVRPSHICKIKGIKAV